MTLVLTDAIRADFEPPPAAGPEVESVAPNQSVSLDDTAAESTDPPRYVRSRGPAATTALPGGESLPWYRTGLGALAIVLAVVGGVYWLVRRWMPGVRSIESSALCVTGRATLSPKHSAALIQLGRRFVLVGVSPERVSLLCEVSDPGEVAELAARTGSPSTTGKRTFDRLLAGEAAEYCMETKEESAERPPPGSGKTPRPLGALLNRLRVLQSK